MKEPIFSVIVSLLQLYSINSDHEADFFWLYLGYFTISRFEASNSLQYGVTVWKQQES